MCQFIKDDGEQCSRDAKPFCFQHEDSTQAAQFHSEAVSGGTADFVGIEMDTLCAECETPLRRTERLREHPNQGNRLVFEAIVECDCDEYVLGVTSERVSALPGGWR